MIYVKNIQQYKYPLSLLLTAICFINLVCCNDGRNSFDVIVEPDVDGTDPDSEVGDVLVPPHDSAEVDAEFDWGSELDGADLDSGGSLDIEVEGDVDMPFDCRAMSVVCTSSAGSVLNEGDSVGIVVVELPPTCRLALPGGSSVSDQVEWSSTIPPVSFGSQVVSVRSTYSLPTVVPGHLQVRAVAEFGDRTCEATLGVLVSAPDGLFVAVSWDDGFAPDPNALSDTDIDTHLVRGASCFEDPQNDLYFATNGGQLDWGSENQPADDPQLTYDSRKSPGFEAAWIEAPAQTETVFVGFHGFDSRSLVGTTPVNVAYTVYLAGSVAAEGVVPITKGEYAAVGALRAGEWLPATVETRPDGLVCPVLSTPAP